MTATTGSGMQQQKWKCTQMCVAFKLSLCVLFLIIVIMLSDTRFRILLTDSNLQGQLLLSKYQNITNNN